MLTLDKSQLTVDLDAGSGATRVALFHYVWLRDNCPCNECVHPDTGERLLVTSAIPDDIAPLAAKVEDGLLIVTWNDNNHQSQFDLGWLAAHDYGHSRFNYDPAQGEAKFWGSEMQQHIPTFDYRQVRSSDETLLQFCTALRDYGLIVVRGAPLTEGEIERFAVYIAVVRETIYDRLHNVKATPGEYNAYNVASTTLELKPHTDMPIYNNPPGVQMFHFLMNESVGGESTAVDGFHVAAQLKATDPQAYDILASTPVNFRMFSARGDINSSNPLLTLDTDGQLKVFRYSNQLTQAANLPTDEMEAFYRAYRKLGRMIEAPENRVQFKLGSGDIMVTNNLRVMHGRNSYDPSTGGRHLQLSYMDMDDVLSRMRMILKKPPVEAVCALQ